jgi:hypothetical protein
MTINLGPGSLIILLLVIAAVVSVIVFARRKSAAPRSHHPKKIVSGSKRSGIISTMCILGYVWALVGLAIIISPTIKKFGTWYPALFGIFISLKFISYVGVWHMKKWGVELLLLAYSFEICLAYVLEYSSPTNIAIGILSLITFLPYYTRMQQNL